MGLIFARSQKSYDHWRRLTRDAAQPQVGLSGAGLEQHVAKLRQSRPDLVRFAS